MRLPNSLLDTLESNQRLVVTVFGDAKSLFSDKYPTTSVISATLNGAHVANLEEPIILWFRRDERISKSNKPKKILFILYARF